MPYTACVLEEGSRTTLVEWMHSNHEVPTTFEILAHHCTVDLKPIAKSMGCDLDGQRHELRVVRFGRLEGILAVEVETLVPSKNPRKHITLACDKINGWKPMRSNDIAEWLEVEPFTLYGIVKEVA
jgi:hypothetical protein